MNVLFRSRSYIFSRSFKERQRNIKVDLNNGALAVLLTKEVLSKSLREVKIDFANKKMYTSQLRTFENSPKASSTLKYTFATVEN